MYVNDASFIYILLGWAYKELSYMLTKLGPKYTSSLKLYPNSTQLTPKFILNELLAGRKIGFWA